MKKTFKILRNSKKNNKDDKNNKDNFEFKINLPFLMLALISIMLAIYITNQKTNNEIDYSEFKNILKNNPQSIKNAEFEDSGSKIKLHLANEEIKIVILPRNLSGNTEILDKLDEAGIKTKVQITKSDKLLFYFINYLLPLIIILPLLLMMFRGSGAGGGMFSFGKNKAKLFKEQNIKITFDDVAGVDEAKQELEEVVEFLKNPGKFRALGAKIPKGILLVGAPGTGKTLLAKAIAGEAKVPFFSISGSDFVEMFVGVGASRVRDLFEQARKQSPCIVFVDEVDAVGRQRGVSGFSSHDEREQTLNQMLVEMDGFEETNTNVIVLAATNRPDVLDSALTRPGRFDRQVVIDYPDSKGRKKILEVHSKGKILDPEVDLSVLAKRTPGFSGAQLANVMNEAALIAAGKNKKHIENVDLDEAVDKVWMGVKRTLAIPFEELEMTAYHEVGHALIAMTDKKMPFHKVTIIPRATAMGVTWSLSKDDYVHWTKNSLMTRIKVALGGIVAEELVFHDTTAGVVADLENATQIARRMVTQFGMSPLGPVSFSKEKETFLGNFGSDKNYSEYTAQEIDKQISQIINYGYDEVKSYIEANKILMEAVVLELLKKETLDFNELDEIKNKVENNNYNFDLAREEVQVLKEKINKKEKDHDEKKV